MINLINTNIVNWSSVNKMISSNTIILCSMQLNHVYFRDRFPRVEIILKSPLNIKSVKLFCTYTRVHYPRNDNVRKLGGRNKIILIISYKYISPCLVQQCSVYINIYIIMSLNALRRNRTMIPISEKKYYKTQFVNCSRY